MNLSIDNLLYRAFNPVGEIFNSSALWRDNHCESDDGLSTAERIANDSCIRFLLQKELSFEDNRILQLYFTSSRDINHGIILFDPVRAELIRAAKLASTVNDEFVDLVALSEFWDFNLLIKVDAAY